MSNKRELLSKTKHEFYNEIKRYQSELKPTKEIEGYAASAIVGEKGYPDIKVHNVSNQEKESSFFNTADIVKKDYSDVIKAKARNILGSTDTFNRRKVDAKIVEEMKDIYKAKKPVEFSSEFENELRFDKILLNKVSGIVGSKNSLKNIEATENIKTSSQIEKYSADDIKSTKAVIDLYEKGINEHQIINLLALGSFGISSNRKAVPTRWAISAYDQIIEKHLHEKITKYKITERYEVYKYSDKGNHFIIILYPSYFCCEVIETWDTIVEKDFIGFDNKLHKTEPATAGGFYATKLGVFEALNERKKQAAIISVRVIKDYEIPLGVVFVRECVREAMKNKIFETANEEELKKYLEEKYPKHNRHYLQSQVLTEKIKQKRLSEFI